MAGIMTPLWRRGRHAAAGFAALVMCAASCGESRPPAEQAGPNAPTPTPVAQNDAATVDDAGTHAKPTVIDAGPPPAQRAAEQSMSGLMNGADPVEGVAVGIVSPGRSEFYSAGTASSAGPATRDTLFNFASLTKPITATLVAKLAADGHFSLKSRVGKCRSTRHRSLCSREHPVTWLDLLRHTSGMPPLPPKAGGKPYSKAQLRAFVASDAALGDYGKFRYSTAGVGIAALMAADRAKSSYEALAQKLIFEPLKMNDAAFDLKGARGSREAIGFRKGKPAQASPTREAFRASGGLVASVHDLQLFLQANLEPSSAPSLRTALLAVRQHDSTVRSWESSHPALGWQYHPKLGVYWHTGLSSVTRSFMGFDPEAKLGIVIVANRFIKFADKRVEHAGFALFETLRPPRE